MSPYPVEYQVDFVEERSRLTTFFRLLLLIPHIFVLVFYGIATLLAAFCAWFALLFTARYPQGLYDFVAGFLRYGTRVNGYMRFMTDVYPPFDGGEHPEYPVRLVIAPPKESYSRLKVFFRWIVGIPVLLINYALNILVGVASLISFVWIVVTGKQNRGLHDALVLGLAYGARTAAYFLYLTEDWPPFSPADNMPAAAPA